MLAINAIDSTRYHFNDIYVIRKIGLLCKIKISLHVIGTPVVGLGLEHHTGDTTNQLGETPRRYDKWRHHLSPPPQFCHGIGDEGNIFQSPALVIQPTSFGPTDLTSKFSVCTPRVFGGIGHRTQAFRSGVRCSNHQTTHGH
ncbi:hypothetical protein TNCV_3476651 [Trichonephila clavipes]|nr:hypothetical protein TNCV_3476651 [Trichonephila clavipes]